VDLQPAAVIVNEARFPESVHEVAHPRASCTHHLREGLLTDLGDYSLGCALLAEMSEQQQNPSQSFFTGIKKVGQPNLLRTEYSVSVNTRRTDRTKRVLGGESVSSPSSQCAEGRNRSLQLQQPCGAVGLQGHFHQKSPSHSKCSMVASFPLLDTTVNLTLPLWI
jgi:hypothetical protein